MASKRHQGIGLSVPSGACSTSSWSFRRHHGDLYCTHHLLQRARYFRASETSRSWCQAPLDPWGDRFRGISEVIIHVPIIMLVQGVARLAANLLGPPPPPCTEAPALPELGLRLQEEFDVRNWAFRVLPNLKCLCPATCVRLVSFF